MLSKEPKKFYSHIINNSKIIKNVVSKLFQSHKESGPYKTIPYVSTWSGKEEALSLSLSLVFLSLKEGFPFP